MDELLALLPFKPSAGTVAWFGIAFSAVVWSLRFLRPIFAAMRERAAAQRDKLQNERERLQAEHRTELDRQQRHITETYQALVDGLATQLQQLRGDIANVRQEAASAHRLHDNCRREVESLQETIRELTDEKNALKARVDAIERQCPNCPARQGAE